MYVACSVHCLPGQPANLIAAKGRLIDRAVLFIHAAGCRYIVAGAFGFAGTICLYKGLKLNSPRLLSWGKVLYWASYATILATIAILIYALTRISELKAAGADIQW